jgi:hypothetical protein
LSAKQAEEEGKHILFWASFELLLTFFVKVEFLAGYGVKKLNFCSLGISLF